jgi:hypothetical protein
VSFKKQPSDLILYLDRNIGTVSVPIVLREHGISFELHDDHLPQAAPDEAWVKLCSSKGWIAITLDKRLVVNAPVKNAARGSKVSIFVVTSGSMTGRELGELIAKLHKKIVSFAVGSKKPFLATISKSGKITRSKFP